MDEGNDEVSVMEHVKKQHEDRQSSFYEKMKFWEATKPRPEDVEEQLKVNDIS